MKKLILLTASLLIFAGCKKENTFTIEGTLDGGAGKMVYIEELTPDGAQFLDSIQLDKKGRFTYKGKYDYQTFYNLHASRHDYVVLLPYRGEDLKLSGAFDSLSLTYKVDGSKESTTLWQLQDYSNYGAYKLRDIVEADKANRERYGIKPVEVNGTMKIEGDTAAYREAKKTTDSLYREAYDEQVMYVTQFLEENSGSLATLIALYKPFNGNHPIIDVDRFPELFTYYEQVLDGLEGNDATADNPHTIAFKNVVERVRFQVQRNKPQAVNFALNPPDGSDKE